MSPRFLGSLGGEESPVDTDGPVPGAEIGFLIELRVGSGSEVLLGVVLLEGDILLDFCESRVTADIVFLTVLLVILTFWRTGSSGSTSCLILVPSGRVLTMMYFFLVTMLSEVAAPFEAEVVAVGWKRGEFSVGGGLILSPTIEGPGETFSGFLVAAVWMEGATRSSLSKADELFGSFLSSWAMKTCLELSWPSSSSVRREKTFDLLLLSVVFGANSEKLLAGGGPRRAVTLGLESRLDVEGLGPAVGGGILCDEASWGL